MPHAIWVPCYSLMRPAGTGLTSQLLGRVRQGNSRSRLALASTGVQGERGKLSEIVPPPPEWVGGGSMVGPLPNLCEAQESITHIKVVSDCLGQ